MLTLIRCPFHPRVTAVARKRSWSFRWQVTSKHTYTLDPTKLELADYTVVQALCESLSGNELINNLPGNTQPQLSQLAEPLWTDPGLKSGISARANLHTHTHTQKKAQAGNEWLNIPPKSSQVRKKPQPPPPPQLS